MPIFTAAEMTEFRALKTDLAYHDSWLLVRKVRVSDGRGGSTTTEQTVAGGPGMLRVIGGELGRTAEQLLAERLGWTKAAALDAPLFDHVGLPLDIRPTDVIVVNGTRMQIGGETTVAAFLTIDRTLVVSEEE